MFLLKFSLEVRFERWEVQEKKYLAPHVTEASAAVVYADFTSARKKKSAFYKNPATAGLVVWDFL